MTDKKVYSVMELEGITDLQLVAVKAVMNEGALRFQEQVTRELEALIKSTSDPKVSQGIVDSIKVIETYETKFEK